MILAFNQRDKIQTFADLQRDKKNIDKKLAKYSDLDLHFIEEIITVLNVNQIWPIEFESILMKLKMKLQIFLLTAFSSSSSSTSFPSSSGANVMTDFRLATQS